MIVAFSGYYGMKNFGDDLFVAACDAGAALWQPTPSKRLIVAPEVKGIEAKYLCPSPISSVYDQGNMAGACARLMTQLRGRLTCDLFVFGGGSLFKGISLTRRLGSAASTLSGGREAAIGVSIGPFKNASQERSVALYLKKMEYISVRDDVSRQWLSSNNIDVPYEFCGDLVGLCQFKASTVKSNKRKVLGVSLAQSSRFELGDGSALGKYNLALIQAVKKVAIETGCAVFILDLNGNAQNGDWRLSRLLDWELRENGIQSHCWSRRELSSWALAEKIGECDAIVSGRLHGAIVAYLQGIPFTLVEYEEKCTEFLNDIGQGELRRLPFPDASAAQLQTRLLNLFAAGADPCRSPDEYRRRSLGHFSRAPWAINQEPVQ